MNSGSNDDPVILALNIVLEDALMLAEPWEKLMLESLRRKLDDQAESIALEVEARQAARKPLAQLAKGFKSAASCGSVTVDSTDELVKAFKAEVDATTKRAKTAESHFFALYRLLRDDDLGDPGPLLRRCHELGTAGVASLQQRLESNSKTEAQAQVLFARLGEMGLSSAGSSEKLQEGGSATAALEKLLGEERKSMTAEAEREAAHQWDAERLCLKQACDEAVAKASGASDQRVELLEAQLAMSASMSEEAAAALASRLELEAALLKARTDREALESRLSTAQRTLEDCSRAAEISAADSARVSHEATLRADQAEAKAAAVSEGCAMAEAVVKRLEAEVAELRTRPLASELDGLKRQIAFLESLQFEEDDDEEEAGQTGACDDIEGGKPTGHSTAQTPSAQREEDPTKERAPHETSSSEREVVAQLDGKVADDDAVDDWFMKHAERMKKQLERERVVRRESERALRDLEVKLSSSEEAAAAAGKLARKLEGELVSAHSVVEAGKVMLRAFQARPEYAKGGGGGGGVSKSRGFFSFRGFGGGSGGISGSGGGSSGEGSSGGGAPSDFEFGQDAELEAAEAAAVPGFGTENRLLEAVQGQRDRFRRDAQRREGELALAKRISDQVTSEAKELRQDNIQLYKKVRFLSSGGSGGAGDWSGAEATESKYASMYEASVDPFMQWESKERLNASARLCLPDRALLTALEWLLPSSPRRAALLLHLALVHILLFWCRLGDAALPIQEVGS